MYSGFCSLTLVTAFFAMPETKVSELLAQTQNFSCPCFDNMIDFVARSSKYAQGMSLEQIEAKYREGTKRQRKT